MSSHQQEGCHYVDTGFPYTISESFMDFFHGTAYVQPEATLARGVQDEGSAYWSMMHSNSHRYNYYGSSSNSYCSFNHAYEVNDEPSIMEVGRRTWNNGSSSNSYCNFNHAYEVNDEPSIMEVGRRTWNNHVILDTAEPSPPIWQGAGSEDSNPLGTTEECIQNRQAMGSPETTTNPQIYWQDDIDPDRMTYEELLDLGEALGTQSRGLSKELISSLPVSKYKCSLFSRRKTSRERCVICQMNYKRGDRQMTLPCRHMYHAACASKWLGINKACPVCFVEVFGDASKR